MVLILAVLVAGLVGVARGQVTITEFTIATGDSAVWDCGWPGRSPLVDETAVTKIGRITTAGIVTEFRSHGFLPRLKGIAAGPDNLWFTDYSSLHIGPITQPASPPS